MDPETTEAIEKTAEATQEQPQEVTDHNVQVIPQFDATGKLGAIYVRLQPIRNEVVDAVLAIVEEINSSGPIKAYELVPRVEALRGGESATPTE